MAGLSSSSTTSTPLSTSSRTSLKKPVAKSLIASAVLVVGHGVAHLDRQIVENGAGFGALNPFDPNILMITGSSAYTPAPEWPQSGLQ